MRRRKTKVKDFELVRWGFDNKGTFPGIGIKGTRFRKVVCGVGTTEEASFIAAMDLIEQAERIDLGWSNIEDQAGELGRLEVDGSEEGEGKSNGWFYFGIRYNFAA